MDAIVIAGGTPQPSDKLFSYSNGKPKAMIPIGDRPMIVWVLQAFSLANGVDDLIVVGIDDENDQQSLQREVNQQLTFLPNTGGLVSNGLAGLEHVYQKHGSHVNVIGCSSDIPHMQAHMIDDLIKLCQPLDRILYYAAITPDLMESAYPNAKRTYANFSDQPLAGCDIFVSTTKLLETNRDLWRKVVNARKNPLAMAWTIGFKTLFKLAIGRLSVQDATALAGRLLEADQPIGVVYPPYAQLAMDGDKPHQIDILREKIAK